MINSYKDVITQLTEGQVTRQPPYSSKLPIPYHLIPGELRMIVANFLFKGHAKSFHENSNLFPASYLDNSIDQWLLNITTNTPENSWFWPDNKKCALVLSHDTDTRKQEKGITSLINIAKKRGLSNTFSFVGKDLPYYNSFIMDIKEQGIEIALHDYIHDNKIAFMDEQPIIDRLSNVDLSMLKKMEIVGFRSPSWYVSQNLWSTLAKYGFIYDMSALDTYPLLEKGINKGVCTYFPFINNNLVILPNTIPFELPLFLGYKMEDIFAFWQRKFDDIANNNGLIMINAHPDRWYCGSIKAAYQLEKCLDYIINKFDPAKLTAKEVANYTLSMRKEKRMSCNDSKVYTPNHNNFL